MALAEIFLTEPAEQEFATFYPADKQMVSGVIDTILANNALRHARKFTLNQVDHETDLPVWALFQHRVWISFVEPERGKRVVVTWISLHSSFRPAMHPWW